MLHCIETDAKYSSEKTFEITLFLLLYRTTTKILDMYRIIQAIIDFLLLIKLLLNSNKCFFLLTIFRINKVTQKVI